MAEDIIRHTEEERYVVPRESEVLKKLEWFKDQKVAFMVHWGPYSQLGMRESWPLSEEDKGWSRREYTWESDSEAFRRQYFDLARTFNPIRFDPEEWADFAAAAGFRYFIFTTKHHDGFCMYDSRYSPYKITSPDCPFHTNKNADITRALFDAFRARGIAVAPYFSKPDWHCPWYWAEGQYKPVAHDRSSTYHPDEHPEIWDKYVEFTHNQLTELTENYGPIEFLWLDGGQVNPINDNEDVHFERLAPKLREKVPGLLFVDRTVGGEYENYITPEQTVPESVLNVPWESCVTVGRGWSFRFDDDYKSSRELVALLINVVTRGGNLALNLGAQPDGRLPRHGVQSVLGMGRWLKECGEGIYGTRAAECGLPCGRFGFTKKGNSLFAFEPLNDGEELPPRVTIPWSSDVKSACLLKDGTPLPFERTGDGICVTLPFSFRSENALALAVRFEL